ncbi:DUF934 domain-containing protein [Salinicola aestuarinus]|uniref:DUF934 domain-containing protein n=1 Tax=Salinicola aestuarinus TaxID=1949082 RepID=UPI000DA25C39|nr:DUF934 domain-containing protein [Salinicola aestuarinus]
MPDANDTDAVETVAPAPSAKLIRGNVQVADDWVLSRDEQTLPEARPAIVPFTLWQESLADSSVDQERLAPWLASDCETTAELAETLSAAPLVAIDFPSFTDGRGYTVARLLRERFGYAGELRAIGDVLIDQLYYLRRCGFDTLALRDDQDLDAAFRALSSFSVRYQPAIDLDEPLFAQRRRERAGA